MESGPSGPRFGAHVSVAGGLHLAFEEGVRSGCDCLQIFVKNQRQWAAKPLAKEQVDLFAAAFRQAGECPVLAHGSYLLNMAAPAAEARKKTVTAIVDELERCEALGIEALVVHPGAHMQEGVDLGVERIVSSLNDVHAATAGFRARVALETTAGQGSSIGHEIVHLGRIIQGVAAPERVAVCVDTCHVFAAGYDIREADKYEAMIEELERHVGISRIVGIHTNDSLTECGSRVDRHAHIGQGKIGRRGFEHVVNDPRLRHIPMILETPKGEDDRGMDLDRANLKMLRSLVRSGATASGRVARMEKSPGRDGSGRAAKAPRRSNARSGK